MGAVVIIPARLGSTRFPRKVLADRTGSPLVQHVWEQARQSAAERVVIATDADEVAACVRAFGGQCVMTSPAHENGTSRLAEASTLLGLGDEAIVVNVQGDEPEIEPGTIDEAIGLLERSGAAMSTIATPIESEAVFASPSAVKVVLRSGADGVARAMYFSRAPIPHVRDSGDRADLLLHVGIYAYRAGFLRRYAALPPTPLERAEKLEQLRALEHGFEIAVGVRKIASVGVDTPEDYERFVRRWQARGGSV
ncbi:MAG: 3-deoxy-manno-octulosonate cytidylyltransferase [Phycisphaerales bacterium]|nr:3-deoxy-manno-octulosonate cytidylyltransferase [Phycisphaerales bacterium]